MQLKNNLAKQYGAAIIVALFVTALVAAVAVAMLLRMKTDIRRSELIFNANHAYLAAQGSVNWAIDQLINNTKIQIAGKAIDKTPIESPMDNSNGMQIKSFIYDAQGFFNLNNLSNAKYQEIFQHLIHIVDPKIEEAQIRLIISATIDWITQGVKNSAFDAEYTKVNPPYRAAHRMMVSASELRLVKGMSADLYAKLAPYVIALPTATQINVNGADIPVLMSLGKSIAPEAAKVIALQRNQTLFNSTANFLNIDIIKNNAVPTDTITVSSDYFLLQTDVKVGQQFLVFYTLLKRGSKNSKPIVDVLWQMQGTL